MSQFQYLGEVKNIGRLIEHGNTVLYLHMEAVRPVVRVDVVSLPPDSRALASWIEVGQNVHIVCEVNDQDDKVVEAIRFA